MRIGVILDRGNDEYKIEGNSFVSRIVECLKISEVEKIYLEINKDNYYKYKDSKDIEYKFREDNSNAIYCLKGLFKEEDEIIVINSNSFIFDKLLIKNFFACFIDNYEMGVIDNKEDSVYLFRGSFLNSYLKDVKNSDLKGLLDKGKYFVYSDNKKIKTVSNSSDYERVYKEFYRDICYKHMRNGVNILDVNSTYIGESVVISKGVKIYPNNYLIEDSYVGENSVILPNCFIESSTIGKGCSVGPFSSLKKGTKIKDNVIIGAFVEIKNSDLARCVKAKHHAYLGDVSVGENTNIGCGVIIANYDGKVKHRSSIGNNNFIGSNVTIISPVKIGDNVVIGAGSTIVKDISDNTLAIAREKQTNKENYYK